MVFNTANTLCIHSIILTSSVFHYFILTPMPEPTSAATPSTMIWCDSRSPWITVARPRLKRLRAPASRRTGGKRACDTRRPRANSRAYVRRAGRYSVASPITFPFPSMVPSEVFITISAFPLCSSSGLCGGGGR